ncbi:heterokaryon incompatibility protein-domain-containing protein [Xylaria telfairii]|nr:heterokaryon incompatibility protein-domain-containing protein [Xylaria telfairii]
MICHCCMRIFELRDPVELSAEPISHHVSTQSFISSIAAGCPICRAILSELDEPQRLWSDPNLISFTKCLLQSTVYDDSQEPLYFLHFSWKSRDNPRQYYRLLLVAQYHRIRPYLSHTPLEAQRGWNGQTLQMVKTWMHNCVEKHPKCQALHAWRTSGLTFQPKRLVDVGAASEMMWRLILREDDAISPATYATLSHRWSYGQQFKLLGSNIQVYTGGQSMDILPQLFQDAIKVIKSLGIRYVWVDCLCIIQDSLPDWETESLEMSKIYTNSICNISITGFEDNSMGFLDKVCDHVPLPYRVRPRWTQDVDEGWCILDPFFWWAQVTTAPLTKRGWVFQERFLAPRVIHFGPEQVLWECASLDACEAYPKGVPAIVQSPRHTGFKRLDFLFENYRGESLPPEIGRALSMTEEHLLYCWCEIVQAYTRTSLTKPRDKLIALAGVAQLMSSSGHFTPVTSSNKYLAGLFEQHLLLMLEWHSYGNLTLWSDASGVRPPQYRAPSWSWASIDGRVFYDYLPRRIDDYQQWDRKASWKMFIEHLNYNGSSGGTPRCPIPGKCLGSKPLVFDVKSSITPVGESSFGQIMNGTLGLTGRLIPAQDIIITPPDDPAFQPILLYLDAPTTTKQIEPNTLLLPLRCLQLRSLKDGNPFYWVTGLLLQPVDADVSTYQRCGMLSILSTDGVREIGIKLTENPFTAKYSDDIKLRTIKLI